MTFHVHEGDAHQLDSFTVTIHDQDEKETAKEKVRENLQRVFGRERGNKIVRIKTNFGREKTFLFNAGFEKQMYNEIIEWVEETHGVHRYPIQMSFMNFLSFNAPRIVGKG